MGFTREAVIQTERRQHVSSSKDTLKSLEEEDVVIVGVKIAGQSEKDGKSGQDADIAELEEELRLAEEELVRYKKQVEHENAQKKAAIKEKKRVLEAMKMKGRMASNATVAVNLPQLKRICSGGSVSMLCPSVPGDPSHLLWKVRLIVSCLRTERGRLLRFKRQAG